VHFVLVHGAYHGAWCWDVLRRELEADGHMTTATDLPNEDPNAGAERYAEVVLSVMPPNATERVVIVGHSLGGLTIPLVAAAASPLGLVFLAGLVPVAGTSFDDQHNDLDSGFKPSRPPISHPDGSASWPEEGAMETFYQDCSAELARAAAHRLTRQHWRITQEVTPLGRWPAAPATYILCTDDRALPIAYCRHAARDLLGIEPIELPGGHSPFLSRPRLLANILGGLFVDQQ
jgi:pimeloyl-ACP methyl ester carboxylesterase